MKNISIYLIFFFVITIIFVLQAFMFGDEKSVLEIIEAPLEFFVVLIALIGAFFAFEVAFLFGKGTQGKAWRWISVGVILFAVVEILGVLKKTNMWHMGGLQEFIEIWFLVAILIGFITQRKILRDIINK